jgi:hypothetical protein
MKTRKSKHKLKSKSRTLGNAREDKRRFVAIAQINDEIAVIDWYSNVLLHTTTADTQLQKKLSHILQNKLVVGYNVSDIFDFVRIHPQSVGIRNIAKIKGFQTMNRYGIYAARPIENFVEDIDTLSTIQTAQTLMNLFHTVYKDWRKGQMGPIQTRD